MALDRKNRRAEMGSFDGTLLKKTCNFYSQIPATLMPVVDRNNYG